MDHETCVKFITDRLLQTLLNHQVRSSVEHLSRLVSSRRHCHTDECKQGADHLHNLPVIWLECGELRRRKAHWESNKNISLEGEWEKKRDSPLFSSSSTDVYPGVCVCVGKVFFFFSLQKGKTTSDKCFECLIARNIWADWRMSVVSFVWLAVSLSRISATATFSSFSSRLEQCGEDTCVYRWWDERTEIVGQSRG